MGEPGSSRARLVAAGTELIRRQGYRATSVADICGAAGVTKGAFFHHFESKEALAQACLARWCETTASMDERAGVKEIDDPVERVSASMEFVIDVFSTPDVVKSCLAGCTVQEVSQTHPALRDAANVCFQQARERFELLLQDAATTSGAAIDASSLATMWIASIQGSLILAKASGDDGEIASSLTHVKTYIEGLLRPAT